MAVRVAKGLYASPKNRPTEPLSGGLDMGQLVKKASHVARFHNLFGPSRSVLDLVQSAAQQRGWALRHAEIREALEELA